MNYTKTIAWLFEQLPMYQRVGHSAYKANLDNTLQLADYLNHPEGSFKSIHVAGTNGKGSTSHMLASVLQEAGYKVGLYTSPHLKDFRERIKINGTMIPKHKVASFVKQHKPFFESHSLSFFEMTVGLAFDHFRSEQVDIAVVEVGMGGRLDSTNIITPEVAVITNIGLDHTQFLGTTLRRIAGEKAGIIKKNIPVVIGERHEATTTVFEQIAGEKNAPIVFAEDIPYRDYASDLKGTYQQKNKHTVITALRILQEQGWNISEESIIKGMGRVVRNTGLMGRWQLLGTRPKIICDTAHNKEGIRLVLEQLKKEVFQQLHIVLGVVNDKDLDSILPLFPTTARYYFCTPNVPRGMSSKILEEAAKNYALLGMAYTSVSEAQQAALNNAMPEDLVFIGGSTFTVAEVV
ncbi:folylpolyglutamate synthase/dihydrofolate synthase family protein [Altibacter sp.]|uniref:bifunctional folylpolyglutamate synthase/dihydrofolate synthase n=1 Tax=Altibacter sp. TaxID=2024823 RepID=UPI00258FC3D4|nr:folylpolyglutamate synthase/dihydrofolate synthase family protein [Altibacter sp.]MCW9036463.1 bifunctional folylpolyglutamate synthase/dihydrofolate synthase [Altibacter sp.]